MATLKLKIKKALLKRKIDGELKEGYYGRVLTNGKMGFEEVLKESTHGSTLDYREAKLAAEMMLDGIAQRIKQGYIVDLGPLGALYPAVNGKWSEDPDELLLADMTPKVNYKPSDDIQGAVKSATLQWATVAESAGETTDQTAGDTTGNQGGSGTTTGGNSGNGGNGGDEG